jgi:transcriptional regulator PpsR
MLASDHMHDLSGLSPWADQLASTLVSLASDIALVIDADGVITAVAQNRAEPMTASAQHWIGQAWVDTVSDETRRKIELLLDEVARTGLAKRREVNHPGAGSSGIPVAYTAVRLGERGPVLAVGRDLRAIAAIQQRFVDAQQELERVYWQSRQADARDQRLIQVLRDGVLVVHAQTLTVEHANAVCLETFARTADTLQRQAIRTLFDAHSGGAVDDLLLSARSTGRSGEIRARLAGRHVGVNVSATPFLCGSEQMLLVRVRSPDNAVDAPGAASERSRQLAQSSVAIADSSGRLMSCSAGLCTLLGAASETSLLGHSVTAWDTRGEPRWSQLVARVRHDGLAAPTRMTLRRLDGSEAEVEVSGALLAEGDQECVGLSVVALAPPQVHALAERAAVAALLRQLDAPPGSVALPDLLQRLCHLAEQQLVESALDRTGGDLGAAAELLGVSPATLGERLLRLRPALEPSAASN